MKSFFKVVMISLCMFLIKHIPFSYIMGSKGFCFSWHGIITPVCMSWYGLGYGIFSCLLGSSITWLSIIHRLPILCSALVLRTESFFCSVLIPLVCMVLFLMHPIGSGAFLYTTYWLIPPCLYLVRVTSWSKFLQASFVAHAVGSVIWLYAGISLTSEAWLSLIPLVFFERILIAAGMYLTHKVLVWIHVPKSIYRFKTIFVRSIV